MQGVAASAKEVSVQILYKSFVKIKYCFVVLNKSSVFYKLFFNSSYFFFVFLLRQILQIKFDTLPIVGFINKNLLNAAIINTVSTLSLKTNKIKT